MLKKFLGLVLALLACLVLSRLDLAEIQLHIGTLGQGKFLILCLLQLVTMGLLALQWQNILGTIVDRPSYWQALAMNSYGNIIDGITPGSKVGGELSRIRSIRRRFKLDYGRASLALGLQKTISISSLLLLYLASLAYYCLAPGPGPGRKFLAWNLALILGLALLALLAYKKSAWLKSRLLAFAWARKNMARLESYVRDYRTYLAQLLASSSQLGKNLGLGLLIWLLYPVKMYLILGAMKAQLGFPLVVVISYISYILAMLPLLPGSLGSFESGLAYLLMLQGLPLGLGLAVSIIFRFISFWFEMGLSGLILIFDRIEEL